MSRPRAAARNGASRSDDLDLNALAISSTIGFWLGDPPVRWRVPADPDVEVVATLLRLRDVLDDDAEDIESAEALVDARELIFDLIDQVPQEQELDPSKFRISVTQTLALFAKMVGGDDGDDAAMMVARKMAHAVSGGNGKPATELTDAQRAAVEAGDGDAPLRQRRPSSRRRSGSAASTSGRRRGGGA